MLHNNNDMILGFKKNPDRFTLSYHDRTGGWSVTVEVRYYHGLPDEEPNRYKFMRYEDSDAGRELMTTPQFEALYQTVMENEGAEEATKWFDSNLDNYYIAGSEYSQEWERCQEMVQRWEAMIALGLFRPSVTF